MRRICDYSLCVSTKYKGWSLACEYHEMIFETGSCWWTLAISRSTLMPQHRLLPIM